MFPQFPDISSHDVVEERVWDTEVRSVLSVRLSVAYLMDPNVWAGRDLHISRLVHLKRITIIETIVSIC